MNSAQPRIAGDTLLVTLAAMVPCIALALFSPLLSFYACLFFLLACSVYLNRATVRWVGYLCAYSGSVVVASRKTFAASDDFSHYYAAYTHILNDGWQAILDPYGTEVGLPIYYYLLSGSGVTNEVLPLFAVAFLGSALFVFWIDKHGSACFPPERFGTVMATSLLFYSFLMASQVSRQTIALSFVLFAVSVSGWRSFIWLGGALLFQQTALFMYLLFRFAGRLNAFWITLLLVAGIVFASFFNQAVQMAATYNLGFVQLLNKLTYYTSYSESYTTADLAGLKFIVLCGLAALVSHKYMPKGWGAMLLLACALYVVLLPLPLASLRLFLIFVTVLTGYIASFVAFRIGWSMTTWIVCAYAFYKMTLQLSVLANDEFALWDKFDWIGDAPLYYFSL